MLTDIRGVISRAKSKAKHFVSDEFSIGKKFSGFTIGRGGPLLARIYNKSLEITKSSKTWFKDIWLENGWNEVKDVWRVEFQKRRRVLKEFSISNIDDLQEKEKGLWAYLTECWLVLKKPSADNVSRWSLTPKWQLVQSAGDINITASPLVREAVKQGNTQRLLDQAVGIMMSGRCFIWS